MTIRPRHIRRGWLRRLLHTGRPALVAMRHAVEHVGATADWSPEEDLKLADTVKAAEPDETEAEAAERQAEELADHRAQLERQAAEETAAEMDALTPVLDPLFAAVESACISVLERLGITEADVDEYAERQREKLLGDTAQHSLTELRRLMAVAA